MSNSLSAFTNKLRELPRTVAIKVAKAAAPILTEAARATFNAGQDAYGVSWLPGADGKPVTLNKSGRLLGGVEYVAIGTKLRLRLPVAYAKYQVGRRPITPSQGAPLPSRYVAALTEATDETIRFEVGS